MENRVAYLENAFQDEYYSYNLSGITDGTLLTADGHSFPIHRFLLASRSRYFFTEFCVAEKDEEEVFIPGVRGEVLSNILSYIYRGKILFTESNVSDVIVASHYFSLDNLLLLIKTVLDEHFSIGNCVAVHLSALKTKNADVLGKSYRFIQTHFEEVVCSTDETFCELPVDVLMQFVNDRNLRVRKENVVWYAIVKWVEADLPNRSRRVLDLLMYVRVCDVDYGLAAEMLTHEIVANNPYCRTINLRDTTNYRNILEFHQCVVWNAITLNLPLFKPRRPLSLNFIACCLESEVDIYVTYDENTDLWRKIMEGTSWPSYLACIDDCIYVIEARTDHRIRYNFIERETVEFSRFIIPRSRYAFVQLGTFLYVLGGVSRGSHVRIVETYNPEEDAWFDAKPLFPVIFPSAVTLDGFIYVVGKTPGRDYMIAQRYNPDINTWEVLSKPLISRRKNFTVFVYQGKMCLIGGINAKDESIREVEVFSPSEDAWNFVQRLPYAYCCPKPFVIKDKLIVSEDPVYRELAKEYPPVQWNDVRYCWEAIEESSPLFNVHDYFFAIQSGDSINVICKKNKMPTTVFEKSPFS